MDKLTNDDIIRSWSAADPTVFGEEGDLPHQLLLNPALFSLLGEVAGERILDAGCGQGYLCRMLAKKGAQVTGVEPSEAFFTYVVGRERQEPLGITYLQADLSRLDSLPSAFDVAIANMVLIDIPEYEAAMATCVRALRPGGSFIFSLSHPCFEEPEARWREKRYVEVREYLHEHMRAVPFGAHFHRPLSRYFNLVIDLGCTLTRFVEPELSPDAVDEIGSDRDCHVPSFIVVAATKR